MRVVTWNLWWRFGPWQQRRRAILSVLAELRPDVVGLQEVWAADGENLAGWLAGELGLHWMWEHTRHPRYWPERTGEHDADSGNAVLSRWPISDRATKALPSPRHAGRLAVYARLDTPGRPLPFFTTHLTSAAHASAVRREQVRTLAAFVAERTWRGAYPPVLTGDFNAWPDSDEIRLLGGYRTEPAAPGLVLLDAWEFAAPGTPAVTWDPRNPYVPDNSPGARIDYVFAGPGWGCSPWRAGDGPVGEVWPSDHAAVVADLTPPA
ncbi:endonuclease [Amycolatopsis acidicola]|uniref:Endonuclease n=1 Tax=Amycolatopsis acidicola TaxID=2596893 RepID=A0A5N0UZB8_9PSEU|nr:endonuclease/exonuclease/phosphatase family protein [Amycolatopsis acidicola]KAA9155404.1 endonuclease [Amycolatopsis acidicola]